MRLSAKWAVCAIVILLFVLVLLWRQPQMDVFGRQRTPDTLIYKDYCVVPNLITNQVTNYERITLVLHASAHYLNDEFVLQMKSWDAPISLSVYLYEPTIEYLWTLYKLTTIVSENAFLRDNIRVHFFYRKVDGSCRVPLEYVQQLPTPVNVTMKAQKSALYPSNVARNIARMFTVTKYTMIGDYDHYFSLDFEKKVREVAHRELDKNPNQLLVTRRFEVSDKVDILPRTKQELSKLIYTQHAVVFHELYYKRGHWIDGLPEWLKEKQGGINGSGISLKIIPYKENVWEPIFVSLATISQWHDENIPYPLDDNVSLRLALCRAGYQFSLLSDHFIFHKGIKMPSGESSEITEIVKRIVGEKHKKSVSMLQKRLDQLFPGTAKQCPSFKT